MLQERVLYILEQNRGRLVTGGEIAKKLGVSRTAIWKTINALRQNGNDIKSMPNSGYRLTDNSDGLTAQSIHDCLTTQRLGRSIEFLKTVHSTSQHLKAQDSSALSEGHVVIADEQTGGRGRLNRPFYSPAHNGIYLSCFLKPPIPLSETPFLTICAAVAVCRAIESICNIQVGIKWVNDIYHDGKKLCGILTEAFVSAEMQSVDYTIIGIGVNTGNVAPEVKDIATSTYLATGIRGIRNHLIAEILNQFERIYLNYTIHGKKKEILAAYTEKLFILGKHVEVVGSNGSFVATALGVNDSGGLIVKHTNGEIIHVSAGEIRIIREKY